MKILVDARIWGASGVQEYSDNLSQALLGLDKVNQYSFFVNSFRKKPIEIAPPSPEVSAGKRAGARNDRRVMNWGIPNKLLDFSARFFNFPAIDRFITTDLVFSPHFNILAKTKAPRIITFHDLSFLHHPQFFSRRQRFWHWTQNVKRQAREATHLIAVSEFTKSDLVNLLGVPEEKISVVYSGVAPVIANLSAEGGRVKQSYKNIFKNNQGKIATASGLAMTDVGRPYILYLGTLEPRKNLPALIRAFNILKQSPDFKDWRLVLAGRPGWLYRDILKELKNSPYRGDIVLKGGVSAQDKVSLYNSAKVFVYPSFFEGFGFPPLEAQASGCPVVAADRTSLPEILGDSALLVNPWKIEDLAEAIRTAALDSKSRDRLIKAGLENVKKFTWENTAKETLNVFKSVM